MSETKVCWMCAHYDVKSFIGCKAFPGGIPHQFASREAIHDKVVEGQVGNFVWERNPSLPAGK